jgi:hypothetical protein
MECPGENGRYNYFLLESYYEDPHHQNRDSPAG